MNQLSGQDAGSNIELLKSRVADLERKFGQLMAELEILKRKIGQINQQVESLETETLLQVGWSIQIYKLTKALLLPDLVIKRKVSTDTVVWGASCRY